MAGSPDEYPFTQDLPEPVLGPLPFPKILHPNNVNVNPSILSFYTRSIVPRITKQATLALAAIKRANGIRGDAEYEDDGNYGSAATIDVEVLAAISKRVHYGACARRLDPRIVSADRSRRSSNVSVPVVGDQANSYRNPSSPTIPPPSSRTSRTGIARSWRRSSPSPRSRPGCCSG